MSRCETREVYTISVDSMYAAAPNASNVFTAYLNVPLRNVVRAELLSASIDSTGTPTSNVVYVQVEELVSKFHDHAVLKYQQSVSGNTSNVGTVSQIPVNPRAMAEAFATIHAVPSGGRFIFTTASQYAACATYINPIRKLDKLTVSLYDQTGASLIANAPTFMIFRFECSADNQCLY